MDGQARWSALMQAAQRGDAAAYAALLRECVPLIRAVAVRQGVAPGAVDDVVQDVLLAVHRARATYDPAHPFLPWLRTIAQRRAIDRLRGAGRTAGRELHAPAAYDGHPDPAPDAPDRLAAADRAGALRRTIAALPAGQRQAIELLGLQEMTLEQAATATGRSKTALKVNLHRALKSLRARMLRDG